MINKMIYKKELLCEDARLDIANLLFSARADKGITLDEVAQITSIPKNEIDALETYSTDLDFNYLAKLLDFYQITLEGYIECFPGLSEECYKKYFR